MTECTSLANFMWFVRTENVGRLPLILLDPICNLRKGFRSLKSARKITRIASSLKRPKTGSAPGRGEIRIAKAPASPDTCLAVCRRVRSAARVRVDHADHMGRYAPRLCYRADRHRSPRPPPPALRLASAALPELQSTRRYRWRTCSLLPRSVDMTMYIG